LASVRQRDKNISAMTISVSQEQRPIKRAARLRRLMCHDPNSAEASHMATPPDRAGNLSAFRPRDCRHASLEADRGNKALRLRMLFQVNGRISLT
jgi:hypothetical protein